MTTVRMQTSGITIDNQNNDSKSHQSSILDNESSIFEKNPSNVQTPKSPKGQKSPKMHPATVELSSNPIFTKFRPYIHHTEESCYPKYIIHISQNLVFFKEMHDVHGVAEHNLYNIRGPNLFNLSKYPNTHKPNLN
jgi:hypothetical protein